MPREGCKEIRGWGGASGEGPTQTVEEPGWKSFALQDGTKRGARIVPPQMKRGKSKRQLGGFDLLDVDGVVGGVQSAGDLDVLALILLGGLGVVG